jgi:hypothetical protein
MGRSYSQKNLPTSIASSIQSNRLSKTCTWTCHCTKTLPELLTVHLAALCSGTPYLASFPSPCSFLATGLALLSVPSPFSSMCLQFCSLCGSVFPLSSCGKFHFAFQYSVLILSPILLWFRCPSASAAPSPALTLPQPCVTAISLPADSPRRQEIKVRTVSKSSLNP